MDKKVDGLEIETKAGKMRRKSLAPGQRKQRVQKKAKPRTIHTCEKDIGHNYEKKDWFLGSHGMNEPRLD